LRKLFVKNQTLTIFWRKKKMKNLITICLVVVCVMAAMANAMVLKIYTNGYDLASKTVAPGGSLPLSIYTPDGFQPELNQDVYFGLVVTTATASFGTINPLSGYAAIPPAPDATWLDPGTPEGYWPAGSGVYGFIGSATRTAGGVGTYIDGITFNCLKAGTAVVQLWTTTDFTNYTLVDSLTVHQIPEPATLLLLGLGGFALRKRK
jgi:hypothetical protein